MRFAILIILIFISNMALVVTNANDKYSKHSEVQYSKYYEKTETVTFNAFLMEACSTNSTNNTKTLNLKPNPTCANGILKYNADLYLDLRIGDDHYNFGNDYLLNAHKFKMSIKVDVKIINSSTTVNLLTNYPLTLDYDPDQKIFHPQEILKIDINEEISSYDQIDVTIIGTSIQVSNGPLHFANIYSKIKDEIQLEAFYEMIPLYDVPDNTVEVLINNNLYDDTDSDPQYKYINTTSELDFRMVRLEWETDCPELEFEKYEVQILKLENTESDDASYLNDPFKIKTTIDWNDALSIEVNKNTHLDIFLTQGEGVYTWRVRPIGNYHDGGITNIENWGMWNAESEDDGTEIDYTGTGTGNDFFKMIIEASPDDDLNWTHSRVFNEKDLNSTSFYDEITYSDDLLGKRQYQKKVNSNDNNLIAEFYPDYHGNALLNSLFAPVSGINHSSYYTTYPSTEPDHGSDFLYKENTLKNNGSQYDESNFANGETSDAADDGLIYDYYDAATGKGIPTSNGYPFTRSIYYNDGTNRLKEQRLPGEFSHDESVGGGLGRIKTFYATVSDEELVALFGKEAPSRNKCFKIINIDQNGIFHYTYKGIDGKVIATAYRNDKEGSDLELIQNVTGHRYFKQGIEELVTDYYPIENSNQLTYREEKDIFMREGDANAVSYEMRDNDLNIDVCDINGSGQLTSATLNPDLDVTITLITSNNGDYTADPTVQKINYTTRNGPIDFQESSLTPTPITMGLLTTEPATFKVSRTIDFDLPSIDAAVESYKNDILAELKDNIYNDEINYLNSIINGVPDHSMDQFKLNLLPPYAAGNELADPPVIENNDWGWDGLQESMNEDEISEDGYLYKSIPSLDADCNYGIQIPQFLCDNANVCALPYNEETQEYSYEEYLILEFATMEVYHEGQKLDFTKLEDFFWEPDDVGSTTIRRLLDEGAANKGKFDDMIANMLLEEFEDDHYVNATMNKNMTGEKIWEKDEICDCLVEAVDQFKTIGIVEDEQTGLNILNTDFSLMYSFLSCTGTMFEGYSNTKFASDTYCGSNSPLSDNVTFEICYDGSTTDDLNDGVRSVLGAGILYGGGYFENAYKYLPDFIQSSLEIDDYDLFLHQTTHTSTTCDCPIAQTTSDEYKMNINPEYDSYSQAHLTKDDPRNLDYYYQFVDPDAEGQEQFRFIQEINKHADFHYSDYTFIRNEYKRIYEQWHNNTYYVNYVDVNDEDHAKKKKDNIPDDYNPCDNNNLDNTRDEVMTDELKEQLGSDFDMPDCMKCDSDIECDASDISAFLYQFVTACKKTCDLREFRESVVTEFHYNTDAYYVVEGDKIREFDFGTYEIEYDEITGVVTENITNVETDVTETFDDYNIEYITNDEINRYVKTLEDKCNTDCEPNCFAPEVEKYVSGSSKNNQVQNDPYDYKKHEDNAKNKAIIETGEPTLDPECLQEDIARIMKVTSSKYEIELPKLDCDGNPSYCETDSDEDGWEILDLYALIEKDGEVYYLPTKKDIYIRELLKTLNSELKYIKSEQLSLFDQNNIMGGNFMSYLPPDIISNPTDEFVYRNLFYYVYRPFLYSQSGIKHFNHRRLKLSLQKFDPNIKNPFYIHHDCNQPTNYHTILNNSSDVMYSIHPREKYYIRLRDIYAELENNFLSLPDIILTEEVKDNLEGGIKTNIYESESMYTFPPNFLKTRQYKTLNRNESNSIGDVYDEIYVNDYFTHEGDYIEVNRDIYDFYSFTNEEFWDVNNNLVEATSGDGYLIQDHYTVYNPDQLSLGNKPGHLKVKGQFLKLPEFEEPEDQDYFCFRWVPQNEENLFDEPFERELIVDDCEFNEPDMYLEMIDSQIEDIATRMSEDYRTKILVGIQDYVYGTDDDGTDDLDELKVEKPDEDNTKFTLYYYDHHGNLVKTVPPKGVDVDLTRTKNDYAEHEMETQYQYNSSGQLVASKSADQSSDGSVNIGGTSLDYDGETVYIYDLAGRLRFTVNPNQMTGKLIDEERFQLATYYRYDKRGRLIETGEMVCLEYDLDPTNQIDYYTVGDYLRLYLKRFVTGSGIGDHEKFYKYERQFAKYLLDNIDYPTDDYPPLVVGNPYDDHIDDLVDGTTTSLSASNHIYRQIGLKIQTTYDEEAVSLPYNFTEYNVNGTSLSQQNLRNRISKIVRIRDSKWNYDNPLLYDAVESYYSYDLHGNVEWYYQYIQPDRTSAVPFSMLTHYEYDLISGNVTKINYQPGKPDEFSQIYDYDTDNRLVEVTTSRYGILKESDVRYEYYDHGPLKRKEYGSDHVQGMDYYYTIQGWLKGINDVNMNSNSGEDALGGDATTGSDNLKYAHDVFAMSLNYHDEDFESNANTAFVQPISSLHRNLYNGNISSWQQVHGNVYNAPLPHKINDLEMVNRINEFEYDLSGRLLKSNIRKPNGSSTANLSSSTSYSSEYEYDLNGNILDIERVGDITTATVTTQVGTLASYTDNASKTRDMNRLFQTTHSSNPTKDYSYDFMGNLTEKVDSPLGPPPPPFPDYSVRWTADNKIDTVIKKVTVPNKANHSNFDEFITYTTYYYDGMGNKVLSVTDLSAAETINLDLRCNNDANMQTLYDDCVECVDAIGIKATYYGREAGGKVLATYDTDPSVSDANGLWSCHGSFDSIWIDDWYVYGSAADGRVVSVDPKETKTLGLRDMGSEFPKALNGFSQSPPADAVIPSAMVENDIVDNTLLDGIYQVQQRVPGFRRYEIKDHLGNVRTVISDIKNPYTTSGSLTNWTYLADIRNISNMYPYGKSYPAAATYSATEDYNYGYNGMEKAKEVDDNTNHTHFRNLDLDVGRWWSRDPEELKYVGMSPYVSMGNNPILFNDARGDVLHSRSNYHSLSDVKSIVMEKNRPFIQSKIINNNKVEISIDFSILSKEEIGNVLNEDKGLTLLYLLINSKKKYLYEAVNYATFRTEEGNLFSYDLTSFNDPIINMSDNGRDSEGRYIFLPIEDYNGQVIFSPNFIFYEVGTFVKVGWISLGDQNKIKDRNSIVFHEIAEMYYRTELGIDYQTNSIQPGAHYLANKLEDTFWNRSNEPGRARSEVKSSLKVPEKNYHNKQSKPDNRPNSKTKKAESKSK